MQNKKGSEWCARPCSEYRFFLYDPDGQGLMFFDFKEARDDYAKGVIEGYLDEHWAEQVNEVVAGEVTHTAQQTNREERPEDHQLQEEEGWSDDCDYRCNYELLPIN